VATVARAAESSGSRGGAAQARQNAVASQLRRRPADVAADLAALGFRVAPPDPAFDEELRAEAALESLLAAEPQEPASVIEDAMSPFTGACGRPLPLHTLAAVALHTGQPLSAVARTASKAGLRHDAESWFDPAPPGHGENRAV
jgi:hypothetical protein